ncbi:hypothetical protein CaCOL14_007083 [Colletotrichum acutatum]
MSIRREIDKDGDLILVLSRLGIDDADVAEDGEDDVDADAKLLEYEQLQNKEVRVSSKVLMLNSPVFKVMLGGKFKEGTELSKSTGLSLPYSLDLPDDDAEAMSILSQILHNAYVTERPRPIGLARLAFVCDKYECTGALKYCGMTSTSNSQSYRGESFSTMKDQSREARSKFKY